MSFLSSHPNPLAQKTPKLLNPYWQLLQGAGGDYLFANNPQPLLQQTYAQSSNDTPQNSKKTPNIIAKNTAIKTNIADNAKQQAPLHAKNLNEFWGAINALDGIYDKANQQHLVKSYGILNPELLIIADAPMDMEVQKGTAFQSRFFTQLQFYIAQAGFALDHCHFSHVTFWRPAGNNQGTAMPNTDDLQFLSPYLKKHIRLVNPKKVLLLGQIAIHCFHNHDVNLNTDHGVPYTFSDGDFTCPFVHSFSAMAFNKQSLYRKIVWFDLLKLRYDEAI